MVLEAAGSNLLYQLLGGPKHDDDKMSKVEMFLNGKTSLVGLCMSQLCVLLED